MGGALQFTKNFGEVALSSRLSLCEFASGFIYFITGEIRNECIVFAFVAVVYVEWYYIISVNFV